MVTVWENRWCMRLFVVNHQHQQQHHHHQQQHHHCAHLWGISLIFRRFAWTKSPEDSPHRWAHKPEGRENQFFRTVCVPRTGCGLRKFGLRRFGLRRYHSSIWILYYMQYWYCIIHYQKISITKDYQ